MQTVGIGCELQLFPGASVVPKFNSFSLWRPGGVHTCFQFLLLSSPPTQSPTTSQLPCLLHLSCRRTLLLPSNKCPTWALHRASLHSTVLVPSSPLCSSGLGVWIPTVRSRLTGLQRTDCYLLSTIHGSDQLPATLWLCWLMPSN